MKKIKLLLVFLFITLFINSCKDNKTNETPKQDCCVKEKCDTTYPYYDSAMKELIPFMLEGEFQDDTIGQGYIDAPVIPYKPTKLYSNNKK
jgi:hypothetical protein